MLNRIISEHNKIGTKKKMELNKPLISETNPYQNSWYNWIEDKEIKLWKTIVLDWRRHKKVE